MMTTELVLLLVVYAFILLGVFLGDNGPIGTFNEAAPNLAARIERNLTTGSGFDDEGKNPWRWEPPTRQQ